MDNLLARQMVGQRPPCWFGGLFACCPEQLDNNGDSRDPLRMVLIKRLNGQFELLDVRLICSEERPNCARLNRPSWNRSFSISARAATASRVSSPIMRLSASISLGRAAGSSDTSEV